MAHHHPIAFCAKHGFFPAKAIAMGGGSATFVNCATNCPVCGDSSEIIPGRYDVVGERLHLLLDPSVSPEALGKLRDITQRLQRDEITPAQAKAEAKAISPSAAKLFDIADWSDQAKATLYAAIIGGIALVAAARASSPTIVVQPAIERVIERHKVIVLPGLPGGPKLKNPQCAPKLR